MPFDICDMSSKTIKTCLIGFFAHPDELTQYKWAAEEDPVEVKAGPSLCGALEGKNHAYRGTLASCANGQEACKLMAQDSTMTIPRIWHRHDRPCRSAGAAEGRQACPIMTFGSTFKVSQKTADMGHSRAFSRREVLRDQARRGALNVEDSACPTLFDQVAESMPKYNRIIEHATTHPASLKQSACHFCQR